MATAAKTADSAKEAAASKAAGASAQDIDAEIARLREDIASLARSVQTYGSAKSDEVKARASRAGSDIAAASQDALDQLRQEFEDVERQLTGQIRRHPVQSIGIAAGVGFLLAFLMRR